MAKEDKAENYDLWRKRNDNAERNWSVQMWMCLTRNLLRKAGWLLWMKRPTRRSLARRTRGQSQLQDEAADAMSALSL